jgi:uncharacterized protein (DUF934 family)
MPQQSKPMQLTHLPYDDALIVANTTDVRTLDLSGVHAIALHFPKFTDGRAYTQAYWLRRRLGFAGWLIATGDVLVDQVQQMQRCGFSLAVLRADQDLASAQRMLALFDAFYQGDASQPWPHFANVQTKAEAAA